MEHSTTQVIKQMLVGITGLSKDALHVHVGLTTMFATAMVFRKALRSLGLGLRCLLRPCVGRCSICMTTLFLQDTGSGK